MNSKYFIPSLGAAGIAAVIVLFFTLGKLSGSKDTEQQIEIAVQKERAVAVTSQVAEYFVTLDDYKPVIQFKYLNVKIIAAREMEKHIAETLSQRKKPELENLGPVPATARDLPDRVDTPGPNRAKLLPEEN